MSGRPGAPQLDRWRRSPAFADIARRQAALNRLAFAQAERCGATKRTDGEPCKQMAMKNGRCYLHGGRTPKGAGWHKLLWPDKAAPNAEAKLNRKLDQLARLQRKREHRIARMTPEELAAYRAWQRSHQPGPPGPRARRRAEHKPDAQMAAIVAAALAPRPAPAMSAELAAIEAEISRLQAQTAALNAEAEALVKTEGDDDVR